MNGQRVTVGLIIVVLVAACLIQTSMTSCSRSGASGASLDDDTSSNEAPFFRRASDEDLSAPTDWNPVPDNVLEQVRGMYEDSGIVVEGLERSESGAPAIRCVLARRDGVSECKQLLDGLFLLHNTYPAQYVYRVDVEGDENWNVESDWPTMLTLVEEGYSFETESPEADMYWTRVIEGIEPEDETSGDHVMAIQADSS